MTDQADLSRPTALDSEPSSHIHLRSTLPATCREEIEELLFFNPKQPAVRDRVRQHVEHYGFPAIGCHDGNLFLELSRIEHAQALFILNDRDKLVGVLIYVREADSLKVLYMALAPAYTKTWQASCSVISSVVVQLRKLAKPIKGIRQIEFSLDNRDVTVGL